jgi:thioredoxin-dependent peroxiredoxin
MDKIKLEIGNTAPDFTAINQKGEIVHLYDILDSGRKVLLVFYPKDFTSGCTTQLCGIRDVYSEYKKHGVVVLGVNPASEESHAKFIAEYSYPFDILVDTEKEIILKYGANGMLYGRPRIMRGVFLISTDKTILYRFWGQQNNEKVIDILAQNV